MPQSYCTPHRQSVILDVEGGVKHEWSRMCVSAREQHFMPQFFFSLSFFYSIVMKSGLASHIRQQFRNNTIYDSSEYNNK